LLPHNITKNVTEKNRGDEKTAQSEGKVLSLPDKRLLVIVLSFCGWERERDASATGGNAYCAVGLALTHRLERASEPNGSRSKMSARSFSGFNVSCPWQEVAVSTVSFSLLYLVLSFSVVRFEYSFVYVSLHSA
jgi:hypothetical protein